MKKIDDENDNASETSAVLEHRIREALEKVNSSPVLNGGFETLIFKIDKIEESQGQIVEKVDSIHEAIYHPDDGLFTRINTNKNEMEKTTITIEHRLAALEKFQTMTLAAFKWFLVAAGGGVLTFFSKLIYTALQIKH